MSGVKFDDSSSSKPPRPKSTGNAFKQMKNERFVCNPSSGSFTIKRNQLKQMQDVKLASQFCDWITDLSDVEVFPDTFVQDLSDGVALLRVVRRFGQVGTFHDYKGDNKTINVFKARENRLEFIRACQRLEIQSAPDVEFTMTNLIPCLLELATIADTYSILQEPNEKMPEEIRRRVSVAIQEPSSSNTNITNNSEGEENMALVAKMADEATTKATSIDEAAQIQEKANAMLKDLHLERMDRQKRAPPKIRDLEIGGKSLKVLERPGESMGSIVWTGSLVLIEYLSKHESTRLGLGARVLELGAGVGVVGIYCSMTGAHVTVTDKPEAMDLLWANVASNANNIVKNGGSCVARALSWQDPDAVTKVKQSLIRSGVDNDIEQREVYLDIVVAADVVYGDTMVPLSKTISRLFEEFKQHLQIFLCYKRRSEQEEIFFGSLKTEHGITFSEVGRGEGDRSNYIVLKGVRSDNDKLTSAS